MDTGEILDTQDISETLINAAAWSPDGTRIAYGGESGEIVIIPDPLSVQPTSTPTVAFTPTDTPIPPTLTPTFTPTPTADHNIVAGDEAGLIAAINAANANPDHTTIRLSPGVYEFSSQYIAHAALPSITEDLTIYGEGAILRRAYTAAQNFRLLQIMGNVTPGRETDVALIDLTLENGRSFAHTETPDNRSHGGAILNLSGNLTLDHVTFRDNYGRHSGGGLYHDGSALFSAQGRNSRLTITNTLFENNRAYIGGGIHQTRSDTTINNSRFLDNTSLQLSAPSGYYIGSSAAIRNQLSVTTTRNSCFENNSPYMLSVTGGGNPNQMDFSQNWWNSTSGPLVNVSYGGAENVGSNVNFSDFLTDGCPPEVVANAGNEPVLRGSVPASDCAITPSTPADRIVSAGNRTGLIDAINFANANANHTVIQLTTSDYGFTYAPYFDATYGYTALPAITTPVTIYGQCATFRRGAPIADPSGQFRFLRVTTTGNLTIYGLSFVRGMVYYDVENYVASHAWGGAILNQGTLSVNSSSFLDNFGVNAGGAIYSFGNSTTYANLEIRDSYFENNRANNGGTIGTNYSHVIMENSRIRYSTYGLPGSNAAMVLGVSGSRVTNSCFENNVPQSHTQAQVVLSSPSVWTPNSTVNLEDNWWNSPNGPTLLPGGTFNGADTVRTVANYADPIPTGCPDEVRYGAGNR